MATKKLELGKEKCFQIHVGNKSLATCSELNVHDDIMKTATSEKYLGDLITNTSKIDIDIEARVNKGNGRVNTIISLLEEISFGEHFFEMALLFRNSMLINSLLSSSEVLYNIEMKHINMLEKCDKNLLTRIFSVPSTCSYEAVYLETGCLPIRFILQGRRLLYYWSLLNKDDNELVKKVFSTQKEFSSKNDWTLQVEEDKKELDINISENSIKIMKKVAFKKLVNKENRSKSNNLNSYNFQNYLQTKELSTKEKKLLFALRTRSISVKRNYKNKFKFNMECWLCGDKNEDESETHLLKCDKIKENIDSKYDLLNASYEKHQRSNFDHKNI